MSQSSSSIELNSVSPKSSVHDEKSVTSNSLSRIHGTTSEEKAAKRISHKRGYDDIFIEPQGKDKLRDLKKRGRLDKSEKQSPAQPHTRMDVSDNHSERTTSVLVVPSIPIEAAWEIIPHPKKVKWGGEDALFVQGRTFGVFDGVSGCKKIRGLPLFSKTLAKKMMQHCRTSLTTDEMRERLQSAGQFAKECATGSTTAVVASIGEDNMLRVLNMGDSVLIVIRDGKVVCRTKDTGKSFNVPCQLPFCSPKVTKYTSVLDIMIKPGDVIVAGSDGVFDNLSQESICAIVKQSCPPKACVMAKDIIMETKRVSRDRQAPTPIAKVYKDMGKGDGFGGKKDDMCCVVVQCKQPKICHTTRTGSTKNNNLNLLQVEPFL